MAKTAAERAKAYRRKKRDELNDALRDGIVTGSLAERHENVTEPERDAPKRYDTVMMPGDVRQGSVTYAKLPSLPDDEVVACNKDIGWQDVMDMTKADIDYVYKTWQSIGDDILLRLKRAAGYHKRVRVA